MKFDQAGRDDELRINLDPMIDCIFLLIIFFLVTTSFIKLEQDLSINLPVYTEVNVKKPPARPITVSVRFLSAGKAYYHVGGERMSLAALTVNLSRAKIRNKDQAVVIRGDRRVKWEHVAAVMGCCAHAGISKVSATVQVGEER